jgi:hypothetical protein
MLLPIILGASLVYSVFLSFIFGPSKAAGVLVLTLIAGALVALFAGAFATYVIVLAYGGGFVAISCGAGLGLGVLLKKNALGGGLAAILLLVSIAHPLITLTKEQNIEENEKASVDSWVRNNPELKKLTNGENTQDPRETSRTVGYSNGTRYGFSLGMNSSYYIVVDSFRSSGKSEFRLACIATEEEIDKGKRCDQAPRPANW